MCAKGFGQSQPTKIDKLVESAVRYCHKRHPEALDKIFDNLPVKLNQQVVTGILAAFQKDIDTLSWFCGYMASEINRTQDNQKPHHPIAELSKTLIISGMEPFIDFMPYPGCRLVILNSEKFESLPESIQAIVQQAFDIRESSSEEAHRINIKMLSFVFFGIFYSLEVPKQVIRQELAQAIAQIKDLIEKRNGGVAVPAQEVVPVERQVLPDYLTIGGLSSFF